MAIRDKVAGRVAVWVGKGTHAARCARAGGALQSPRPPQSAIPAPRAVVKSP